MPPDPPRSVLLGGIAFQCACSGLSTFYLLHTGLLIMCYMVIQFTWPIAGQCIFICQCHQPNLYVNETGLLPGMGKLNEFSIYL